MTPQSKNWRHQKIRTILLIEGTVNLVALVVKMIIGLKTGAAVILSDAIHSLADLANNAVALMAHTISRKPPDKDHPYGHHKFETICVFGLAILLGVLAVEIFLKALFREAHQVHQSGWGFVLMIGVLIMNLSVSLWQGYWGKKLDSDLLKADSSHTFSDALTTIAVIAGWQFAARGYLWLDTVFSLFVSFFIFYLAYNLLQRSIPILVDQTAIDPHELTDLIHSVKGIRGVQQVRSRDMGNHLAIDMTVLVDSHLTTEESHAIADAIEKILYKKYQTRDITIHTEPADET